ncbi:Uncharacterised protein [Mycobacteroides abscessus subsp. abscessus]|nr:Uncharacterised protein [Mycobacteroides abscessus subsp. abscessus]
MPPRDIESSDQLSPRRSRRARMSSVIAEMDAGDVRANSVPNPGASRHSTCMPSDSAKICGNCSQWRFSRLRPRSSSHRVIA